MKTDRNTGLLLGTKFGFVLNEPGTMIGGEPTSQGQTLKQTFALLLANIKDT
jgi:hypothetical protein